MTESEKIEEARDILRKLAEGINPIDGLPVGDSDVVNDVRIVRCFFYVSKLLEKDIERERKKEKTASKPKPLPFSLSREALEKYQYTTNFPISATAIARKLNFLVREEIEAKRMERFSYRNIFYWLRSVEMIEWRDWMGGRQKRFPTEAGEEIGLVLQIWEKYGRKSPVIYFTEQAERFIIDNIEAVIAAEKGTVDDYQELDEGEDEE